MKKRVIIPMLCLMLVIVFTTIISVNNVYAVGETKDITFEDQNLYNVIKENLSDKISSFNDENKTIIMTQENIDKITYMHFTAEKEITTIKGIENFTNLFSLELGNNQISDISALSGLTNLSYLSLGNNQISDISALRGLTNLRTLKLYSNQISDISALSGLTNLSYLSLGNNQISDIGALRGLTNLTYLYIYNNQISDISALSGLTNLESLELGKNQINDIGALRGLTNLKSLTLYENQISDISALSGLTNLESLELVNNQISDISALSGLTNLSYLELDYNQISDIGALRGLTNLSYLELDYNQISDISALRGLTNLRFLDLSNNQISDASILDNELKYVTLIEAYFNNADCEKQKISINTENRLIELPKIFLQAKDKNSVLYTAEDYKLKNCTLSEDGKKVIVNDGIQNASVKIFGGLADDTTLNISINELSLSLSQTPEEMTRENVVVTITANKAVKSIEGWTLSEDKMTLTKEYERNATEEVSVTDENGNVKKATVSVTNIDKDAPIIEYTTNKNEDGTIEIILKANERIRPVEGWDLSEDEMTLTKTYKEFATEEIKIYDIVGNETGVTIRIVSTDDEIAEIETERVEKTANKENDNNPKTQDSIAYAVVTLIIAICTLLISRKYTTKRSRKK